MANSNQSMPSDAQAARLLQSIGVLLNNLLLQEPENGGRPLRYNPLDYAVLRMIEVADGCSGSDISRELSVARTSVQSAMDRLERAALIEKRPPEQGGRIRTLHLTREGKDMRARIHAHDLVNMRALLSPLSPQERELAIPLLEKVAESLGEAA